MQENERCLGRGGHVGVGELSQKCEELVDSISKRRAMGLAALVAIFITTAPAVGSEPSEIELRAVISTWHKVKQVIETGAPVSDRTPAYRLVWGRAEPMSNAQKQQSIEIARGGDRWREIWFMTICDTDRVTVFFMPEETQGRLRRGKSINFPLNPRWIREQIGVQILTEEYVQIGDEPLRDFRLGEDNRPFEVEGGLTLDEVSEIVQLIRAPQKPVKAGYRLDFHQIQIDARDRTEPIISIRRDGDRVYVTTGYIRGMWAGQGQGIGCKKVEGIWVITSMSYWNS